MSWKIGITIAVGLLLLYGLFTVGLPFLFAIVLALFLEPAVVALHRVMRVNRIIASTIVCTLFLVLMGGIIYWIGAGVFAQLMAFIDRAPGYMDEANRYLNEAVTQTQLLYHSLPADVAVQIQGSLEEGVQVMTSSLKGVFLNISGYFLELARAVPNVLIAAIVFLVALYLFSFSLPELKRQFVHLFEPKSQPKVEHILANLRSSIFGFLRAQMILSALTYIVSLVGLLLLGVQYPLAIALLIVVVDILPILGTGSVLVPWAIVVAIKGEVGLAIGLVVLFLVLTVFRRIVEPKILGDSIGIGALPTLVSLYVGFKLMGVVGLFFGPVVIMIYYAMRKVGLLRFTFKLE